MTDEDRVNALLDTKHLTPRQARFVLKVLLHAGVAVQRQYFQFAGIARGEVTRDFFKALVRKRLATAYPCARDNAQLYHFHNRTLYERIGEPNSRFRKRGNVARALERLMILDAVLATPSQQWLATERDKVERFIKRHNIALADLPRTTFGSGADTTQRFFIDKFPIGVGVLDEITLMYPMLEPTARVFRTFLENHRRLLKRLARWRILLVGSRSLKTAETAHRRVLADFCAPPLPLQIGEEFRWYCQSRRAIEAGATQSNSCDQARFPIPTTDTERARCLRARRAFSAPRFYTFYRRWCRDGDVSLLDVTGSPFYDAARRDGGIVDTLILPHAYANLAPLAEHKRTSTADAPATPLE